MSSGVLTREELNKIRSRRFTANLIMITLVLTAIGVGMEILAMPFVFYLGCVGMLPAIVANLIDTRKGRYASKCVTAFNMAGVTPNLAGTLASGSPNHTAATLFENPESWVLMYGFAGFGWGIVYLIPRMAQLYFEISSAYHIEKLAELQKALVDEWSEEVKAKLGLIKLRPRNAIPKAASEEKVEKKGKK